jgi:hypothetical protein
MSFVGKDASGLPGGVSRWPSKNAQLPIRSVLSAGHLPAFGGQMAGGTPFRKLEVSTLN